MIVATPMVRPSTVKAARNLWARIASTERLRLSFGASISVVASPARFLPGDSVEVRFEKDYADYDQTVVVDLEGGASFLLVGRLTVLGKSPQQVEEALAQ